MKKSSSKIDIGCADFAAARGGQRSIETMRRVRVSRHTFAGPIFARHTFAGPIFARPVLGVLFCAAVFARPVLRHCSCASCFARPVLAPPFLRRTTARHRLCAARSRPTVCPPFGRAALRVGLNSRFADENTEPPDAPHALRLALPLSDVAERHAACRQRCRARASSVHPIMAR